MKVLLLLLTVVVVAAVAGSSKGTDPVSDNLLIYKKKHKQPYTLTTSGGAPVPRAHATNTLNTNLLNNDHMWSMLTKLVRERIPERTVHAQGSGAFGYIEILQNVTHICKAEFLNPVGKKTPVAMRFSTSHGSLGSPDLNLDTRGFSVKIYTREGNFDMPGFNTPVFSSKEPLHGHNIIHTARRNSVTNAIDPNMSWDKFVLIPESLHQLMYTYSGRGIPASFAHMGGWPVHTYQMENKHGVPSYCRLHYIPEAGIKHMPAEDAKKKAASEPDYLAKDLYRRIAKGDYPSWTLYFQCLSEADVDKEGYRPFDLTRTISEDDYPLIKVARVVLNRNPRNHFAEIEQLAFCPCNVVPGILGAPDSIYQVRRMLYNDAQNYRLGKNSNNIPVNCPFRAETHTYDRDGMPLANIEDGPNYYPNSFNGPEPYDPGYSSKMIELVETAGPDNFDQMRYLYTNGLTAKERTTMVKNIAASLKLVTIHFIQEKAIKLFKKIHEDFGKRLVKEMNVTSSYY